MVRKKKKICLVCGKEFDGTEAAFTCSGACRTAMHRILANGKKPDYWLVAKSKGQKIPLFSQNPIISKLQKEVNGTSVKFGKISEIVEVPQKVVLTKEQQLAKISELEQQIASIKSEQCPLRMHPKVFALDKESRIDRVREQLEEIKKQTTQ